MWHLRFHYHHSLMIDRWKVDFNWYIKYYSYIVQNKVVIELETEYPLKTNIKRLHYYMFFYLGQWSVSRITWSLRCSQNLCVTKYVSQNMTWTFALLAFTFQNFRNVLECSIFILCCSLKNIDINASIKNPQ